MSDAEAIAVWRERFPLLTEAEARCVHEACRGHYGADYDPLAVVAWPVEKVVQMNVGGAGGLLIPVWRPGRFGRQVGDQCAATRPGPPEPAVPPVS